MSSHFKVSLTINLFQYHFHLCDFNPQFNIQHIKFLSKIKSVKY